MWRLKFRTRLCCHVPRDTLLGVFVALSTNHSGVVHDFSLNKSIFLYAPFFETWFILGLSPASALFSPRCAKHCRTAGEARLVARAEQPCSALLPRRQSLATPPHTAFIFTLFGAHRALCAAPRAGPPLALLSGWPFSHSALTALRRVSGVCHLCSSCGAACARFKEGRKADIRNRISGLTDLAPHAVLLRAQHLHTALFVPPRSEQPDVRVCRVAKTSSTHRPRLCTSEADRTGTARDGCNQSQLAFAAHWHSHPHSFWRGNAPLSPK